MAAYPTDSLTLEKATQSHPGGNTYGPEYRLPPHHQQVLKDAFRGEEESRAGIRTRYLPDGSSQDHDQDIQLHDLERYIDQTGGIKAASKWRTDLRRAHETVNHLRIHNDHTTAAVLAVTYGYPDPITRDFPQEAIATFKECASLIRYTDLVEAHRIKMARRRAMRMISTTQVISFTAVQLIEQDELRTLSSVDALSELLNLHPEQRPIQRQEEPIARYRARAVDTLMRRLDRLEEERRAVLHDPNISETPKRKKCNDIDAAANEARNKHAQWVKQNPRITREDDESFAIRLNAYEKRQQGIRMNRVSFIVDAKAEASTMLTNASRTYMQTWQRVQRC